MKKYKILFDYGSEGFKFEDGDFETVDIAVKYAVSLGYGVRFLIVEVVWDYNDR